jgi:hypothetical protein
MSALAAVAPRVGRLIRLLGSSHDGEALGACRALARVLASAETDFHELAATIEATAPAISPEGCAPVAAWHAHARWLDERPEGLTRADRVFVQSMLAMRDEPTRKQKDRIRALYEIHMGRAYG